MKIVSLVVGLISWLIALPQVKAQPHIAWVKHYGPENGLAHREVNTIFQDRQGFMWFGTKFGLNRFDGKTFTTFTKERNGLDFDDIQSIAQDADGYLWLMGPHGKAQITLFNPVNGTAIPFEGKFNKLLTFNFLSHQQRVLSSTNGTIFFTNGQPSSLVTYHPNSGLHYAPLPPYKKVLVIQVTARNTVWAIADNYHLIELTTEGRILHHFHHQETIFPCFGSPNAGTQLFYVTSDSTLRPRMYYRIDELGNRYPLSSTRQPAKPQSLFPIRYAVDSTGLIWDGTRLLNQAGDVVLAITDQLSGETITNRSFFCDRSGWMWLGTSFGVYQVKLTKNRFRRLFYEETNSGEKVAAIRGITVIGDQVFANLEKFGLYSIPRQGGTPKKRYASSVFAYGLVQDSQGKLYAGNTDQVVQYNPVTSKYSTTKLLGAATSWCFYPLGADKWLIGCQTGLLITDLKSGHVKPFTGYNQFAELAQSPVLHMAADRQGIIWVCSASGLYRFDLVNGITARYWSGGKGNFLLPADSYQHMYQDTNGIYWLATANAGLIRWDRRQNQFRQFRRSEGLANDNIYAVYPDRRGNLWLSSDYGIMQFNPVQLTTRSYFVQDGITHNEFNRISHAQDQSGRIYFGGLNGITMFDPQDFAREKSPATLPLRIVSFRQSNEVDHQLIDKTEALTKTHKIVIRPGDQTAVLEFALLNFTDAQKNIYAYQFNGLDTEWTTQTESTLRLGNLPYGTYQLLIKGQASTGQWSGNTLSIQVDVQRPFYGQVWFLVLSGLVVVAGIWSWLRWRSWNHQQEQQRLQNQISLATFQIEEDKQLIEKQAGRLRQLNATKSRFFANISHEFRTPLTVILGMAGEVKQKATDARQSDFQRAGDLIERNGSNLLRLINQILDLSKLEAGEMHLQPIRADLVRFMQYVAESVHTMADLKGVQLQFSADCQALETDFDRNKLQDILSNLVTNAIKFTPAGGRVYLQLTTCDTWSPLSEDYYEALSPAQHRKEPWIFIRVRDTGPGIEANDLPHIFDRFYQRSADAIAAQPMPEIGGTGIGLSLVRELVGLMQGGLAVCSLPGQGAEFVISLRQTRQAPLAPIDELGTRMPGRLDTDELVADASEDKPVLLVVEDNEDVATYITYSLRATYQIIRADNGQTGIDLAFEKIPDLILSDVMMPQKDGFQLCDTVKNDPRTSHIPLVLLTARAAFSDRISGLRRGADAYLTKPFQPEELQVTLNNLLQSRRNMQLHYSQLALQTAPPDRAPGNNSDSLEDQFLHQLQSILSSKLDNAQFSIDELCQQMGMSRTTLHMKLKALTGMSTTRYIRALRLGKAKELLRSSGLNISEIAYAVGFDDPKYFSRVFSDEFGVSPANFRLSAQAEQ